MDNVCMSTHIYISSLGITRSSPFIFELVIEGSIEVEVG
jgi:hypothetical protein